MMDKSKKLNVEHQSAILIEEDIVQHDNTLLVGSEFIHHAPTFKHAINKYNHVKLLATYGEEVKNFGQFKYNPVFVAPILIRTCLLLTG